MAIPVRDKGGSGEYKLLPAATHSAVCDMVVNIGNQRITWAGKEKIQEKVYFRFEVPKQRIEYDKDGEHVNRPLTIGLTLTNNLNKKAGLRAFLESWRGQPFTEAELKDFDLTAVLGAPCLITVEHKEQAEKTYANITAIRRFTPTVEVAGTVVPVDKAVAEMPLIGFHPEFQPEKYEELPEWLQKKIEARVHPEAAAAGETTANPTTDFKDDDIPF